MPSSMSANTPDNATDFPPDPNGRRRRRFSAAVLAILVILGVVLALALNIPTQSGSTPTTTRPLGTLTVSPTSSTTSTPTSSEPPPPPPVNDGPAPANYGSFEMHGAVEITGATYDSMPYVLPLNPAGPQQTMVRWVDGWGVSPQNAKEGTVYILGHAWGQAPLVFNPFSEKATYDIDFNKPAEKVPAYGGGTVARYSTPILNGSSIIMKDAEGHSREWVVDKTWLVNKTEAINDVELNDEADRGRIILIACAVRDNRDLEYNVIVSGRLKP
ncbi:sortase [Corynebacterium spheniscorum]|nr:sortase [Corynebacterium spheniscorum]KAA8719448.1 sortase [Corynebacterium spheniscorum]